MNNPNPQRGAEAIQTHACYRSAGLPTLWLLFSLLLSVSAFGQQMTTESMRPDPDATIAGKSSALFTASGVFDIPSNRRGTKEPFDPRVRQLSQHMHPSLVDRDPEEVAAALEAKQAYADAHPELPDVEARSEAITPTVLKTMKGNYYNGYLPPDNSMAISNSGYIVSATNSSIQYLNTSGSILYDANFSDFFSVLGLSAFYFDPKVLYDPYEGKFMMVVLSGNTSSNSKVAVAFSKTSNPNDGWWFYTIEGDYLNDGSWFDYPSIGVSTEDLVVTGNLFSDSDIFSQSILFQIDKTPGFTGGSISWRYWYDIRDENNYSGFTLTPASYGLSGAYGPGMYLVSNYSGGGTQMNLWTLTDRSTGSPSLTVKTINCTEYSAPYNGSQLGTTRSIRTNDCRVMNAYYRDGEVFYVHNTRRNTYWTAIYAARVNVSTLAHSSSQYGLDGYEYAFPSIAAGSSSTKNSIIGFLRTSDSSYPEFRAVALDEHFGWSSSVSIKGGETYVNTGVGDVERWGDYGGIARNHSTGNIWVAGCYGESSENGWSNVLSTYIGEIQGNIAPVVITPVANFSANSTTITAGEAVGFTDLSSNNPTNWYWSLSGGIPSYSYSQNPLVTYANAGTYTVSLTATNTAGSDTETKTAYITVNEPVYTPVADFTASATSITAGESITFTDQSSNTPTGWSWSFTGGSPSSSTSQSPSITYNTAGTYSVSLTASNNAGSNTETKTSYITVVSPPDPPVADFEASATTHDEGGGTYFYDLSTNNPTSWSWTFDGGSPSSSTEETPYVTYNTAGTYSVSLTTANSAGSDTETKTSYITVNVPVYTPVADFSASATTLFAGESIDFYDESSNVPVGWEWTFEGGDPSVTTEENPTVTYTTPGTYSVTLEASNSNGTDTEVKTDYITVNDVPQAPEANFAAIESTVLAGNPVNFLDLSTNSPTAWDWSFPGGNPSTSTEQSPTVTYATTGSYEVTLTVSNVTGSDTETKANHVVVVAAPETNFTANTTTVVQGNSVSFTDLTANDPTRWEWTFDGGSPGFSSAINPIVSYSTPGTYSVTLVTSNDQGTDTEVKEGYITVQTLPAPTANFTVSRTTIQVGESVTFSDLSINSPTSWSWTFDGGSPGGSGLQNPAVTYHTVGTYAVSLTATNSSGSDTETKSAFITVNVAQDPPIADFAANTTTPAVSEIVTFSDLSSEDPTDWTWSFPGGFPASSSEQNPQVIYMEEGEYSVTLTAENEGGSDVMQKLNYITVSDVPTGIGDGPQETAMILYPNPISQGRIQARFQSEDYQTLHMSIYASNGRKVVHLVTHRVRPGEVELSFDVQALESGQYFLILQNDDATLYGKSPFQVVR